MFEARLRKVGNSYVVTVPAAEMRRRHLRAGDYVGVEIRPALRPELRAILDDSWEQHEAAYRYLAHR